MVSEAYGKISLQVFGGHAGCDFLKNHSPLVPLQSLTSHATVDAQKRLCGWAKFPIHPSHSFFIAHKAPSSSFFLLL